MQLSLDFEGSPRRKTPILGIAELQAYLYAPKLTKTGRPTGLLNWQEHRRIAAERAASYLGQFVHPDLAEDIGVDIMLECIEKMREHLRKNTFLKSGYNFFGILNSAIIRAIIDRQRQYQRRAKSALHAVDGHTGQHQQANQSPSDVSDDFASTAGEDAQGHDDYNAADQHDAVILDGDSLNPSGFTADAVKKFITAAYAPDQSAVILACMVEDKASIPSLITKAGLTTAKAKALHLRALAECRQWFTPEPITIDNHDGSCYVLLPTWKDGKRYCAVQYHHTPGVPTIYLGTNGNPVEYKHGFRDEQQARKAIARHIDPDIKTTTK